MKNLRAHIRMNSLRGYLKINEFVSRVVGKNSKRFKNNKGQGMTEYVLILAAFAVVAIVVATTFNNDIKGSVETLIGKIKNSLNTIVSS